ncbi:MAG: hypothetical protein GX347_07710 [Epulopiscium sp.]|nr:hypothetical protein [Candidatus Epulonipiscium sp.]
MLHIRPHHLLCMQAYIGKGYSPEFVEKFNKETFDYICSECEWYPLHICEKLFIEKGYI